MANYQAIQPSKQTSNAPVQQPATRQENEPIVKPISKDDRTVLEGLLGDVAAAQLIALDEAIQAKKPIDKNSLPLKVCQFSNRQKRSSVHQVCSFKRVAQAIRLLTSPSHRKFDAYSHRALRPLLMRMETLLLFRSNPACRTIGAAAPSRIASTMVTNFRRMMASFSLRLEHAMRAINPLLNLEVNTSTALFTRRTRTPWMP